MNKILTELIQSKTAVPQQMVIRESTANKQRNMPLTRTILVLKPIVDIIRSPKMGIRGFTQNTFIIFNLFFLSQLRKRKGLFLVVTTYNHFRSFFFL